MVIVILLFVVLVVVVYAPAYDIVVLTVSHGFPVRRLKLGSGSFSQAIYRIVSANSRGGRNKLSVSWDASPRGGHDNRRPRTTSTDLDLSTTRLLPLATVSAHDPAAAMLNLPNPPYAHKTIGAVISNGAHDR